MKQVDKFIEKEVDLVRKKELVRKNLLKFEIK